MYMAQLGGISYIIIKWIYNVYITFFGSFVIPFRSVKRVIIVNVITPPFCCSLLFDTEWRF